MVEIGKALGRPPSCELVVCLCYKLCIYTQCNVCVYVCDDIIKCHFMYVDACKYFGCELGAQTQMDHKIGRYIVNGAHESGKLQDMLDGFIKKFVLCQECENPETELVKLILKLLFLFVYMFCCSMSKLAKVALLRHARHVVIMQWWIHAIN